MMDMMLSSTPFLGNYKSLAGCPECMSSFGLADPKQVDSMQAMGTGVKKMVEEARSGQASMKVKHFSMLHSFPQLLTFAHTCHMIAVSPAAATSHL